MPQRKRIPPTKPHAPANAAKAPTPLPYLVRMENMTVGTWLRQIAAYRPQLPIEDRLETLDRMRQRGTLTHAEFETLKAKILEEA